MEEEQKQVDRIVQESCERAGPILKRMLEPIQTMLDGSADLRSLKEQLDKEGNLQRLYDEMDEGDLEEILRQGMNLSEMIGRSQQ